MSIEIGRGNVNNIKLYKFLEICSGKKRGLLKKNRSTIFIQLSYILISVYQTSNDLDRHQLFQMVFITPTLTLTLRFSICFSKQSFLIRTLSTLMNMRDFNSQ